MQNTITLTRENYILRKKLTKLRLNHRRELESLREMHRRQLQAYMNKILKLEGEVEEIEKKIKGD